MKDGIIVGTAISVIELMSYKINYVTERGTGKTTLNSSRRANCPLDFTGLFPEMLTRRAEKMSIKSKIKHWWTKPRNGVLFEFGTWVLTDPKAYGVTMIMGKVAPFVLFGFFTIIWILAGNIDLAVIFGIFWLLTSINFYKFIKNIRMCGWKHLFSVNTIGELIFSKALQDSGFGGLEDGEGTGKSDGSDQEYEVGYEQVEGGNRENQERLRSDYKESERTDKGVSFDLLINEGSSEKGGDE